MSILKNANLGLYFLLELCAFAAVGYWGWQVGDALPLKLGLAIGVPLLIAVVWGTFLSPRASRPLPGPIQWGIKLAIFLGAAALLAVVGQTTLAWYFAITAIVSSGVAALAKQ